MGWLMSMHGSTDHLDPEVATEAEVTLRDKLAELFGELVGAGHQGVAGVFHYSKGAPSDLAGPGTPATPDVAAQAPEDEPSGAEPSGAAPAAEAPSEPASEAAPPSA